MRVLCLSTNFHSWEFCDAAWCFSFRRCTITASAEPAAVIRWLISAGLKDLASKADRWEAEDKEEMAESIDEVRGMARGVGRSPGADSTELTDDDAERSGSDIAGGLAIFASPCLPVMSTWSALMLSGDRDMSWWAAFEGGAGKGALAIRDIGDRF
jgi:hypothetical protein